MKFFNTRKTFVLAFAVLLSPLAVVSGLFGTVNAAGVALTASPSEIDGAAAQEVTFNFTNAVAFANTDTLTVSVTPALPAALDDCGTPTASIAGGTGAFGTFSTTGATFTFTGASTPAATSFCLEFPANTPQGSYAVLINGTNEEFGGTLVHVAGNNDVFVTAEVGLELSFNIRTKDDVADTNVCTIGLINATDNAALGTRGGAALTHTCAYGLAIGTSGNGVNVTIEADQQMSSGPTNTLVDIANDGTFVAGTEAYGIVGIFQAQTGGTGSTPVTLAGDFATPVTPVPTTAAPIISFGQPIDYVQETAGNEDNSDLTIIVHGANASAGTPAGVYSQTVTYLVTPQF